MKCAAVFNNENKEMIQYVAESLEAHYLDIELIDESKVNSSYSFIICGTNTKYQKFYQDVMVVVKTIDETISIFNNLKLIQYESDEIKNFFESKNSKLKQIKNFTAIILPEQKLEIKPLKSQDATIFFKGKDTKENLVDEMFDLDAKVHYEIKFYKEDSKVDPSKLHKLSWNVSTDKNLKGVISYKILKEIENGCIPILLKENAPSYFKRYPFLVSLEELEDKDKLILAIKNISAFIARMTKDEFAFLANSIYNNIYIESDWKYNNFLISEEIKNTYS